MLRIDLYEVWTGKDHALTLTELVVKKKRRRRNFGYPKWADLGRRSVLPSTCWPDVGAIGMALRHPSVLTESIPFASQPSYLPLSLFVESIRAAGDRSWVD